MNRYLSGLKPAALLAPIGLLCFAASLVTPAKTQVALPVQQTWTISGTNIYNANTGNVGVGTAAPATKLDVNGILRTTAFRLTTGAAAGRYLASDASGNGTWTVFPASLPPSGAAGGDLTGTYPNPTIAANAVTSAKILDGTIATADLANLAVTNAKINDVAWAKITGAPAGFPPTGAAGGDLAGTYPNPTLAVLATSLNKVSGGYMTCTGTSVGFGSGPTSIGSGNFIVNDGTTGFGGMYINTSGVGRPFYGFAQSGSFVGWTEIDGTDGNTWKLYNAGYKLAVKTDGSIGVQGVTNPQFPLSFANSLGDKIALWGTSPTAHYGFGIQGSTLQIHTDGSGGNIVFGYGGSASMTNMVEFNNGGVYRFWGTNGTFRFGGKLNLGDADYCYIQEDADDHMFLHARLGITTDSALTVQNTATVNVLQIVGADVAEKFPVHQQVKPGMVVAIDAEHPGKLRLSEGAYNRKVAGIISGANKLSVGVVMGNLPGSEKAQPVALSGRVWVYCDASERAVEPGDLLTTAERPGYAMGVDDMARAQGAIIGKAMTALPRGKSGMVLALVNLQ